jgi:hypothetical protein
VRSSIAELVGDEYAGHGLCREQQLEEHFHGERIRVPGSRTPRRRIL